MAKGGARPRSGPAADPNSERSRKGAATSAAFSPTALPLEGHRGRAPAFPLPRMNRFGADGVDTSATAAFRRRELEVWRQVWKTPQAAAWARESWRWPTVGEFCRIKTAVELDPDSNAALLSRLREYRNEIGLSPDGLKMNGWAIAVDEVAARGVAKQQEAAAAAPSQPRRLRGVPS